MGGMICKWQFTDIALIYNRLLLNKLKVYIKIYASVKTHLLPEYYSGGVYIPVKDF